MYQGVNMAKVVNVAKAQSKVVRITTPGPQGPAGSGGAVGDLSDSDVSAVAEGSLLMYDSASSKWKATNTLETSTGTLRINGGNF